MANEWWYIFSAKEKDEQKRDVAGDDDFSDSDRFTLHDDVPMIEEDNDPHNGE